MRSSSSFQAALLRAGAVIVLGAFTSTQALAAPAPTPVLPVDRGSQAPLEAAPAPDGPPVVLGAPLAPEPELTPVQEPLPAEAPPPLAGKPEGPALPPIPDEGGPTPQQLQLRKAGKATMIAGGGLAVVGLALTFAFTLQGNGLEERLIVAEGDYQREGCSRADKSACAALEADQVDLRAKIDRADRNAALGAAVLTVGLAAVLAGGVVYRVGHRRRVQEPTDLVGSLRVAPTLGGAALSGRF